MKFAFADLGTEKGVGCRATCAEAMWTDAAPVYNEQRVASPCSFFEDELSNENG